MSHVLGYFHFPSIFSRVLNVMSEANQMKAAEAIVNDAIHRAFGDVIVKPPLSELAAVIPQGKRFLAVLFGGDERAEVLVDAKQLLHFGKFRHAVLIQAGRVFCHRAECGGFSGKRCWARAVEVALQAGGDRTERH